MAGKIRHRTSIARAGARIAEKAVAMRARKVDGSQGAIVKALRDIPGVTVDLGHDDILVGYQGKTYWFEVKDPENALDKNGFLLKHAVKKSQRKLLSTWNGHYRIVWTLDQILEDIGC